MFTRIICCRIEPFVFFLGVHRFTPNPAIQGDMGWTTPHYRTLYNMLRYWNKLILMNDNRLTKKIFLWDYSRNTQNWCGELKQIFQMINLTYIFDNLELVDLNLAKDRLSESMYYEWQHELLIKPKLEIYSLCKDNIQVENYVKFPMYKAERSLFAQLRAGTLGLKMETGRFTSIPINDRICEICNEGIEDEIHFICHCPQYTLLRDNLFEQATNVWSPFSNATDKDKLVFLMKHLQKPLAHYTYKAWTARKAILFK